MDALTKIILDSKRGTPTFWFHAKIRFLGLLEEQKLNSERFARLVNSLAKAGALDEESFLKQSHMLKRRNELNWRDIGLIVEVCNWFKFNESGWV